MIDRGVRADHHQSGQPRATAYLVSTSNKARNVRARLYPDVVAQLGHRLPIEIVHSDMLENKPDVMFYFTGLVSVNNIESNTFVDGAIADHLTSSGGNLFGGQSDEHIALARCRCDGQLWQRSGAVCIRAKVSQSRDCDRSLYAR